MKIKGIFAADDWGLSPGINAGIIELAKRDLLHTVSCMANAPFVECQLSELRSFSSIKFCLHLNFTYGHPITPARLVPSLVDSDGRFLSHCQLLVRSGLGLIKAEHLVLELRAQMGRLKWLGLTLYGIDGHHHIHLWPPIFKKIAGELMERGMTRIRWMVDSDDPRSFWQSQLLSQSKKLEGFTLERCRYLTPKDQKSRQDLLNKLLASDLPLLIHPALYNDFAKVKMSDSLQEERISQFQFIVSQFDESTGRSETVLGK